MINPHLNSEQEYQNHKQEFICNFLKSLGHKIEFIWIGKGSRRRVVFQVDKHNNLGFFRSKTNDLIKIENYDLAEKVIEDLIPFLQKFIKKFQQNILNQIVVTNFDNGIDVVFRFNSQPSSHDERKIVDFAIDQKINCSWQFKNQITPIYLLKKNQIYCENLKIEVDSDVFIQPTKTGLNHIINFLKNNIHDSSEIKKIADLYCGFGVYSFSLINENLSFECFEGSDSMVEIIKNNAKNYKLSQKIRPFVRDLFNDPLNLKELETFDDIIINPPRNGAEPQIKNIAKSGVKKLQYISCNPATFLRDARILIDSKYNISSMFLLDQFYATNHSEVLTNFIKS